MALVWLRLTGNPKYLLYVMYLLGNCLLYTNAVLWA
jgi:hypothetical protein